MVLIICVNTYVITSPFYSNYEKYTHNYDHRITIIYLTLTYFLSNLQLTASNI